MPLCLCTALSNLSLCLHHWDLIEEGLRHLGHDACGVEGVCRENKAPLEISAEFPASTAWQKQVTA